ncbi:hypothetical protein NQ314_014338 [Rhamnusium bicolor]|uniref:Peptidase S1 domain-containing protein n=1 Tax=Rhamnusium bicolor TaxID=1586634 RepID=A0AAV8X2A9_9CUCU|nr:hypothetical protein NQ314_014338 [Rhamnusium bicolor]
MMRDSDIANYPYQLSILYRGRHSCGASLIGERWAVTAAHCTNGLSPKFLHVRAGSSTQGWGGQLVRVKEIHQHKYYSSSLIDYDISVLELASPISHINAKAIPLASAETDIQEGSIGVISGWGTTHESGFTSRHLKAVKVPVVSQAKCRAAYGDLAITDRMFCAGLSTGGRDACQGDSGGPFVIDGMLVGVVSWGIGCARPEYPGVYSNVPALRDFIKSVSGI